MRNWMNMFLGFLLIFTFSFKAIAGFGAYQSTQNLGLFQNFKCSTGLTCTKVGDKLNVVASLSGGISLVSGMVNFPTWLPASLISGTSVTATSGSMYVTQIFIPMNATFTGVKILNGVTVGGANTYIAALYNSNGAKLYNSNLSGTTSASANTYQAIPFTASGVVTGPNVYWIGLSVSGSTDTYRAIPAVGEGAGRAGQVTGQAFGTLPTLTMPTSFTADKGPIGFTY